ncbi:putative ABC transporter ATP-binding protein [Planctomycetes bacterium Poly30]|uniref:Putative ABC transporter ATP-binding protein n=1 Tax=Saltatorellus ferox TaxID=2528018 RepID=A0A518EZV5_9BACT|nr:putative ABC transporter ATP-binding protein [Planctomycetes bacterium Poly30]
MKKPSKRISSSSLKSAFRDIIWPRRKLVAIGLVLILLNRMSGMVLPASTKYLIDDVLVKKNGGLLFPILGGLVAATTLQAITSFTLTKLLSVEAQHLIAELRAKVHGHVLRLPVRTFEETKSGELVSRIMNDVEGVRNLVGTGLVQLFGGIITGVIALFFLLRINATMTAFALIPMALFAFVSTRAFKRLRPAFRDRGKIQAEVTGRLTEALGGIRIIKGFHALERENEIFQAGVMRIFENVRTTLTTTAAVTSLGTFFVGVASVVILGYGGSLMLDDRLTVGDLFSFTLFLGFLVGPIVQMANIGTQMTEAFAGLDRTEELLSQPGEDDDPERTIEMPPVKGHVKFEGVSFGYVEGERVLHEIEFEVEPGTVVALVGSSGSGKSTLAALAVSFLSPDEGRVIVDGVDLRKVQLASYRSQLGLVLQDEFLFDGTIRENLLFARPEATEAEVQEAAERAYVTEFTDRQPLGLDTVIGERGVKLSGGQRQRVTVARAILSSPRILLLDEATSALDTESESYIQESLETLLQGRTTFVIAHRLSTIQRADLILVIEDGRIAERGKHTELMELEGRYHRLYTLQARI